MVAINKSMLALLLCMLSANSFSEKMVETGDSDKPEQILDTVVVTGVREEQALKKMAGNTSVVPLQALNLTAHTHFQEVLVRVPGANFARGNGQEYLPSIRSPVLTGAGGCGSVLSAVDGIPVRASGFCNINELFDAHTEMAERVEVIRGPGSALYGANAMNGIVNIITPNPTLHPEYRMSLEGGPHDYLRTKYSASGTQGAHGFRADVSLSHDGGYRDDSGFAQQKFTFKHAYSKKALTMTTSLSMTNLNQETAGYIVGKDAYKITHLRNDNPNPEAYRDTQSARFSSRIDYQLTDRALITVTPYLRYTDMNFLQHFLPGTPLEENGQKSFGLQSAYHNRLRNDLTIVTGVDVEYTSAFLKQSQDTPTEGSVFLMATIPEGKHYDYEVDTVVVAPFIHTNWQLTERLALTAGLRYEMLRYNYDNRMLSGRTDENGIPCGFGGCRYSRPADRTDRFENWSPKLGLLYDLTDNHQIYLNLAQGFRAPQAVELYRLQREQVEAELDSEELLSAELGFRGQAENLSYELALFAMKKRNEIFRDSDFFNVADGEIRSRGVELAFAYQFNNQFDLALAASYVKHEYSDDRLSGGIDIDGNEVDTAPKHFGSARLGWDFRSSGRVELEWLNQGKYYTDPENEHRYDGHNLFNLYGYWQVTPHWKLNLRVTNLADRKYAERADYTSFSGNRYFPGEPRSIYFGVARKW
ncbi:TonB-dependent receptor [Porticoccus sp.]|uniref:TonB-dependent receptor n=1 Tax=Porticoccus sp. TaxID=2024853 RepID=UPI0025CE6EBC|nr:TonB-dependent receptor [Porticoccus sp.]